jgi:hypothetical protein
MFFVVYYSQTIVVFTEAYIGLTRIYITQYIQIVDIYDASKICIKTMRPCLSTCIDWDENYNPIL